MSGTVAMEGIGPSMRASSWTCDGNRARADEVQLAALLRDRFGIWIGRDLNDRPPFDGFFRGATVHAPDAGGTFAIDGGRVERVLTKGGLVRGFARRHGVTKFTYGRHGDRQYVTHIDEQIGGPEVPATERWTARTTVTTDRGRRPPAADQARVRTHLRARLAAGDAGAARPADPLIR